MSDTKRGRLGVAELVADTLTEVYAVTDGNDASPVVYIANVAGQALQTEIDVAIVDGALADVADEDYIFRGFKLKYGAALKIDDLNLSANECICVRSEVGGVTVRISGTEEETANVLGIRKLSSQSLAFGDFTDVDSTGYIDFASALPAGAIVIGWKATVTTGFAGDTTAVVSVGVEGDLDAFSADVAASVLAAGVVGSASLAAASATAIAAIQTPRVTVTGGADFTSVSAGVMTIDIYYIPSDLDAAYAGDVYPIQSLVSQSLAIADFTDNTNTTGYIDFTTGQLPAGAIVLGWKAEVSEGFVGDTTAVMMLGISGDTNALSADETQSCLAIATIGAAALAAAAAIAIATAQTPRVTVTGTSDFGLIITNATGIMVVTAYYVVLD